ncbi:hypothetical protein F5B22DRAFT_75521 [Xylaria bambusicola]|uniref:uncharacterized protein n=1 Tax=Xylaria bambusicola TaxID=326684 RepID=UPI002008DAE9|nr:uncharacterized protein F5B22DRAFT_75521 [Xylaria bambusicola]KAI0518191.1 hypothetical protein F5B22DRAFT_75521 [Xylaria bambusicola]
MYYTSIYLVIHLITSWAMMTWTGAGASASSLFQNTAKNHATAVLSRRCTSLGGLYGPKHCVPTLLGWHFPFTAKCYCLQASVLLQIVWVSILLAFRGVVYM